MASDPADSTPKQSQPSPKKGGGSAVGAFFASLGLFILEVILPVILASGALWYLYRGYNLWKMNRILALALFALGMLVISFALVLVLDTFTFPLRKPYREQGMKFGSDYRSRLGKIAIGGVLLPLGIFAAANLVSLPSGGTAMDLVIHTSQPVVLNTPASQIGTLVIRSKNPSSKVLGIQALQGFHSTEALDQLVQVANQGGDVLRDATVSAALSQAIASYGADAKLPLLDAFNMAEPGTSASAAISSEDLYTRYFSSSFDSLKTELKTLNPDPAAQEAQSAQVDAAAAQLKRSLVDLQAQALSASSGDMRQDFILRTFLAMNLTQDADLLSFAKTVAADGTRPAALRGSAILLIGKLGGKDEFNTLYPYLDNENPLLQSRALQAILALQAKNLK